MAFLANGLMNFALTFFKEYLKIVRKSYVKNLINHNSFGPSLTNFVLNFKIEKKLWQKVCTPIMVFWAHGLMNAWPGSKKSY